MKTVIVIGILISSVITLATTAFVYEANHIIELINSMSIKSN